MPTLLNARSIPLSFDFVDAHKRPHFKPTGESDLLGAVLIQRTFVQRHLRDVDLRKARITLVVEEAD